MKSKKGLNLFLNIIAIAGIYLISNYFIKSYISIVVTIVAFILLTIIKAKVRGYFWVDKQGNKLSFRQFLSRWRKGVEGVTPLQQSRTTLLSFIPVIVGIVYGIVTTILGKTYWLSLILGGSLPITIIQILSTYQKYRKHKTVKETMDRLKNEAQEESDD